MASVPHTYWGALALTCSILVFTSLSGTWVLSAFWKCVFFFTGRQESIFPIISNLDVNTREHEYHLLLFYRVFVLQRNSFFIGHLWALLACRGLGNIEMAQRRFVLPVCSFHLLSTLSSFYPVVESFSVDSPPLMPFFSVFFQLSFSKLVTGLSICWSCLLFLSPLLDLTFKISVSCSYLFSPDSCFFFNFSAHSLFSQHCY